MKLITPFKEFESLNRREFAKLQCLHCSQIFAIEKFRVERGVERGTGKYCSQTCARHARRTSQEVFCLNCKTLFRKHGIELKRTSKNFCSRSCSAQYNNRHKNLGSGRRSKAEEYLINLILQDFPELRVIQNDRSLLPSGLEIDIVIPSLKFAIELNGPIHYLPIYGNLKLSKIQAADALKQTEIQHTGYNLIVINISSYGYFKKLKIMLNDFYMINIQPVLIKRLNTSNKKRNKSTRDPKIGG